MSSVLVGNAVEFFDMFPRLVWIYASNKSMA